MFKFEDIIDFLSYCIVWDGVENDRFLIEYWKKCEFDDHGSKQNPKTNEADNIKAGKGGLFHQMNGDMLRPPK